MDTSVAFIIDAPVLLSEGGTTSRVQIAKTGTFKDERYGKFAITRADFAKWLSNFERVSVADDRAGLPVDVDHSPEKQGTTEAAGWITALDTKGRDGKSPTPDELWAEVEWNSLGEQLIKDKRYRYLSPSYLHDKKDETGKSLGTMLVGVGMTNRPFLTMATVSLSEAPLLAEQVTEEPAPEPTPDSRTSMALSTAALQRLSLAEGATDEQIDAAIAALETPPEKTLDQLAGEAGKVVLSADEFTSLKTGAAAGQAASDTLKAMTFSTAWDKALGDPKGPRVSPAQKENFEALYKVDAETTLKMLSELPAIAHGEVKGSGGGTAPGAAQLSSGGPEEVDEENGAIHIRAQAILAEGTTKDYVEAVLLAERETGSR